MRISGGVGGEYKYSGISPAVEYGDSGEEDLEEEYKREKKDQTLSSGRLILYLILPLLFMTCPLFHYCILSYPILSFLPLLHSILSYPILSSLPLLHPILSYPLSSIIAFYPILSCPLHHYCILSYTVMSCHILATIIAFYHILSCPFYHYCILFYPVLSYPIYHYCIISYPILSYPFLFNAIQAILS